MAGIITCLGSVAPAFSQGLTAGPGTSLNISGSSISLGCGDLSVQGTLSVGSGTLQDARHVAISGGVLSLGSGVISLSGNWFNTGTFSPGTGSVEIIDGCSTNTSQLTGNTTFYRFSAMTALGRLLEVAAGSTQTFNNALELRGTTANRLSIRSSAPGSAAFFRLIPGGSQNISAVDVADNNAAGGETLVPGSPASANSIDSAGNTNWFIADGPGGAPGRPPGAQPITTLPGPVIPLLALLMIYLTSRYRRNTVHEMHRP